MNPDPQNPVRVLHPITRLIVGGAQENTMYTAARLDKARFAAQILCGPQTGSEGSLIEEVHSLGVPLTILPELVREVAPTRDLQALVQLARFMRAGDFHIVHTHSSKAGILGRLAARLAGIPVIVHTVHGWSFHEHMSSQRKSLFINLERVAARLCDMMIVVTPRDIEKGLQAKIGRREQYHLIRSAIPLEEFDPGRYDPAETRRELQIPPEAPLLGNIGRFSRQKNPLDWVQVAGIVGRALPDCHFLLVGDGPLRAEVQAGLEAEGLASRTRLTGLRRDVARLLAPMDVFLLTSLWEGLPRVIPQAMAMETPVVAYEADGTAEAVDPGVTGFLSPPGKPAAAAEACLKLLMDRDLRRTLGQQGRAIALREFDLNQMVSLIAALYEDLLRKKEVS